MPRRSSGLYIQEWFRREDINGHSEMRRRLHYSAQRGGPLYQSFINRGSDRLEYRMKRLKSNPRHFEKYQLLNRRPVEGEYIIFKKLVLTEQTAPQMSGYILGRVMHFNEEDDMVTIQIHDGQKYFRVVPRMFGNYEEQINDDVSVQVFLWSTLVEPRLIM